MNFEEVTEALHINDGITKYARESWQSGRYICKLNGPDINITNTDLYFPADCEIPTQSVLALVTISLHDTQYGSVKLGWIPTESDILAYDWIGIE